MVALKWMYVAFGLMLIVGSMPFLTHSVKPNPFYGYRTTRTLGNEHIWYSANSYAAFWFIAVGVMIVLAALTIGGTAGLSERAFAHTLSILMLVGLGIATVMSFMHYHRL